MSSRGWEESDSDGKWSKRAVVHITPKKRERHGYPYREDSDDENEFKQHMNRLERGIAYY